MPAIRLSTMHLDISQGLIWRLCLLLSVVLGGASRRDRVHSLLLRLQGILNAIDGLPEPPMDLDVLLEEKKQAKLKFQRQSGLLVSHPVNINFLPFYQTTAFRSLFGPSLACQSAKVRPAINASL